MAHPRLTTPPDPQRPTLICVPFFLYDLAPMWTVIVSLVVVFPAES